MLFYKLYNFQWTTHLSARKYDRVIYIKRVNKMPCTNMYNYNNHDLIFKYNIFFVFTFL